MTTATVKTEELVAAVDRSLDEAVKSHEQRLAKRFEGLEAKFLDFEQNALTGMRGASTASTRSNIINTVMKSDGFTAAKAKRDSGSIELPGVSIKALTSEQGSADSPQAGIGVLANEAAGLFGWAQRPVRLLDVMPRILVDSNGIQYTRLTGFSNAAAAQAGEGVAKAEQTLTPTLVRSEVSTIAVFQVVSRQVLDDAAWLQAELDRLMRFNLMDKLEADLINGDGSNFSIEGLDALATAVSGSSGLEAPDQVGAMLAAAASAGYEASFVIVNPSDFQAWRAERSTTDNLYVSGSWAQPNPPVLWGVPAILSASQTSGEVLAVNGRSVAMLDRQAPTVEMFAQDSDNVQKNLITIRAELRAGLAVFDPAGVRKLTIN